jgi:DNA-binding MarR family transcriptional regulator
VTRKAARTLAAEIKQTRPFTSKAQEATIALLRTSNVVRRRLSRLIEREDVTLQQYNVLRILRGAGTNGASCGEIAERMVNRDPDLTRLLDRLESRGLVERSRDARDRRVVMATITDAGKEALKSLDVPVARVHRERLRHMTRQQLETLAELLALARSSPTD